MEAVYSRAYTEILEILKYLPDDEYERIPKEKIEFFNKYKDNDYEFFFDASMPLEEQNISIEANAIIVALFKECFATDFQKDKLETILENNEKKYQEKLKEKYNPNDIFKNKDPNDFQNEEKSLIKPEDIKWYKKIVYKLKEFFNIK